MARIHGEPLDIEVLLNRFGGVIKAIVHKELDERIPAEIERERQVLRADFEVMKAQFLAEARRRTRWRSRFYVIR
jgi:hypothetical protein